MPTGNLHIHVDSDQTEQYLRDLVETEHEQPRELARKLALYFDRLASGMEHGRVSVAVEDDDGTAATGTITVTQANADADDTVTVCGVVFTVKASPSTDPNDGEFAALTDDNTAAAALDAAIEAHPKLEHLLSSSVSTNVVTVTIRTKGVNGNMATLATSDATAFALSAARFASGAVGTEKSPLRGYTLGKV